MGDSEAREQPKSSLSLIKILFCFDVTFNHSLKVSVNKTIINVLLKHVSPL
jgi:hypothetical protein